jgi:SAM-dependent methyltransferase
MADSSLQDFYDKKGWIFPDSNSYDAHINENLTEVAANYVSQVRLRIKREIGSGQNLLDVGCGPIQYPEYLAYSDSFERRICIDLSVEALKLAELKLGKKGIYIVGDYLSLSRLEYAPYDGATLINVLYHVHKDLQARLVWKILSELNPGGKLVIVYSNPNTISAIITSVAVRVKRFKTLLHFASRTAVSNNPIYFYRHKLDFWKEFSKIASIEIKAWRTFSPQLEKIIFRRGLLGNLGLRILFRLEEISLSSRLAEYSLIILTKKPDENVFRR